MNYMKIKLYILIAIAGIIISCGKDEKMIDTGDKIEIPEGYSLIWSDEFNGSSIDLNKWMHQIGDGTDYNLPAGWGNDELQIYTSDEENSGIHKDGEESSLFIKAVSDGSGGFNSARLTTKDLFSMRFGKVNVRAKMSEGQGIWSAIWMLGDNIELINWPGCGEIDIIEVLGNEPEKMYATLHYTNDENKHREIQESYELPAESFADDFHLFSIDWTPEKISFSIDGKTIQTAIIENDMKEFLRSFNLVMNVAVGGNWPGDPDSSTGFPQSMYVDYVRVFEKDGFEAPDAPLLDIDEESIGQNIEPSTAQHAIADDFAYLGNASILVWGGGGEPTVSVSDIAIDGDSSLVFDYPGENWGGGYMELETTKDLNEYTQLNFSLILPETFANAEIKLESPSTNAAVFLKDYVGTEASEGFYDFSIPLSDFNGLDLSQLSIPFSIWNPTDDSQNFTPGTVLIDRIYFSK